MPTEVCSRRRRSWGAVPPAFHLPDGVLPHPGTRLVTPRRPGYRRPCGALPRDIPLSTRPTPRPAVTTRSHDARPPRGGPTGVCGGRSGNHTPLQSTRTPGCRVAAKGPGYAVAEPAKRRPRGVFPVIGIAGSLLAPGGERGSERRLHARVQPRASLALQIPMHSPQAVVGDLQPPRGLAIPN